MDGTELGASNGIELGASDGTDFGASLQVDKLPRSKAFIAALHASAAKQRSDYYELPLSAGDDYELCFALDADKAGQVRKIAERQQLLLTEIGVIEPQPGIRCQHDDGSLLFPRGHGFDHFLNENKGV